MALIGNCTITTTEVSETEFHEITLTQPNGDVSTENVAVITPIETSYEDVYVTVNNLSLTQIYSPGKSKEQIIHYEIMGYSSKEARDTLDSNYVFLLKEQLPTYNYDSNLLSQCYDHIKTLNGLTNLIND
jgi:hypothetical protein